jgi:hypothetical protein
MAELFRLLAEQGNSGALLQGGDVVPRDPKSGRS